MLTGLKISSLAYKSVFYRPAHNARGRSYGTEFWRLQIQKWNIPMDRDTREDEKNRVICLVIIFTPGIMIIKMSKPVHILDFPLITRKKL